MKQIRSLEFTFFNLLVKCFTASKYKCVKIIWINVYMYSANYDDT